MSSVILDVVKVNSLVIPNLSKARNTIDASSKYGESVQKHSNDSLISSRTNTNAAKVRNIASDLTKRLGTISNNINIVSVKLDAKIEKAKIIEKKNKSRTVGLAATVGTVAGVAAGVAQKSVAKAAVTGVIASAGTAALASKASNKTNVFSSIGKALNKKEQKLQRMLEVSLNQLEMDLKKQENPLLMFVRKQ